MTQNKRSPQVVAASRLSPRRNTSTAATIAELVDEQLRHFSIDPASGKLSLAGHQSTLGDTPRNFTLDPTGRYLLVANQATNNIFVFKRDPATGLLTRTGKEVRVPAPSCLQMRTYGR